MEALLEAIEAGQIARCWVVERERVCVGCRESEYNMFLMFVL